ncbi:MAG: hypothetical protein IPK26_22290 [Planctomycetes bacterium]|nr:hypothetical protein [Planctomycetota bacterium]
MRGGFLHNSVLLDPIETHFAQVGAEVCREFMVRSRELLGFVDLFVVLRENRIACEAELSPDRVDRDVQKAIALAATQLLIVVPHPRLLRPIRRRLRLAAQAPPGPAILVLTLGAALHHVRSSFPLFPAVIPGMDDNCWLQRRAEEGRS